MKSIGPLRINLNLLKSLFSRCFKNYYYPFNKYSNNDLIMPY